MKLIALTLSTCLLSAVNTAYALEPACEAYLRAAEKSAQQPARHSITETGGMRIELVIVGGKAYSKIDNQWSRLGNTNSHQFATERKLIASIRSGKYPISGCRKVGPQSVDGIPTIVYAYTLKIPGMPAEGEAKAFIGSDGLVHAQSTSDAKVRHRYRGVTAPAL
jgi:hypothetical protein